MASKFKQEVHLILARFSLDQESYFGNFIFQRITTLNWLCYLLLCVDCQTALAFLILAQYSGSSQALQSTLLSHVLCFYVLHAPSWERVSSITGLFCSNTKNTTADTVLNHKDVQIWKRCVKKKKRKNNYYRKNHVWVSVGAGGTSGFQTKIAEN